MHYTLKENEIIRPEGAGCSLRAQERLTNACEHPMHSREANEGVGHMLSGQ